MRARFRLRTQARILPLYRVTSSVTCFSMTAVSWALSLMLLTQPASCECYTRVCPRMVLLLVVAQSTR